MRNLANDENSNTECHDTIQIRKYKLSAQRVSMSTVPSQQSVPAAGICVPRRNMEYVDHVVAIAKHISTTINVSKFHTIGDTSEACLKVTLL